MHVAAILSTSMVMVAVAAAVTKQNLTRVHRKISLIADQTDFFIWAELN